MDSFFVHLHSDASEHHYASNKRGNFRNHLAIPINVDSSRYEVALSELSYTYSYPFIPVRSKLYSFSATEHPKPKPVFYPVHAKLQGDSTITKSYEEDYDVYEYARRNNRSIDDARREMKRKRQTVSSKKILLQMASMNIHASRDITTMKDLVLELENRLAPLDIRIMLSQHELDTYVLFVNQSKPHLIVGISYSNKLHKHFEIDSELSKREYSKTGVYKTVYAFKKDKPINVMNGEMLLTVDFFVGETPILSQVSEATRQLATVVKASKNIHKLQDILDHMKTPFLAGELENGSVVLTASHTHDMTVTFTERVAAILGIDEKYNVYAGKTKTIKAKQSPIFELGCRKIYIYTDIVQDQRVGDQVAPLLRVTDYTGTENQLEIKDFNHLHYINLKKNNIDSIQIYLRTEIGEDLPLTFGTVTCSLHFREKRF